MSKKLYIHKMKASVYFLLLYVVPILALSFPENMTLGNIMIKEDTIGGILDCSSRVGKEEIVAMELAIHDINNQQHKNLTLSIKCSRDGPVHAAQAAKYLINRRGVKGIVGPNSWEESTAVAEVGHQHAVPILSLYDSAPVWATTRWPFFVQASPSTSNQMKAVASIIGSWGWRRVNVIYEDAGSASSDILNHLYGALHDVDVQFSELVPLASSDTLHGEMEKLRRGLCRVFVVHTSLRLAERIFNKAKEMGMMDEKYVWIATHAITSMVHAVSASVVLSMEGVIGVTTYVPKTGEDFCDKFTTRFRQKHPEEKNHDPSIFALQAYDAMGALGSAISAHPKKTMEIIEETNFKGLSGKIQFDDRKLTPVNKFQIINIVGRSYRELGFWSDRLGFSTVIDGTPVYNSSMKILGHVFWPGRSWSTPRGWDLQTIQKPLKIGVPDGSLLHKFIKVEYDSITKKPHFSGFSIDIFKKTVAKLKYHLPYDLVPFTGNYNDMVKQVGSKELDAAVGDINIISRRYEYVEFTHAYTESGLCMVVPIKRRPSRAWLFMKPFTKGLWLLTILINLYNGFVIWSIEKDYCSDLKGPFLTQIATLIWMAFGTLFSLHGGRLHSDLSKMATVVWLFVALIITQSYTASLASMLTIQNIEPKIANLETLKSQNAYIGYNKKSFVKEYLVNALHINPNYIKNFTSAEEYSEAFNKGEIDAVFLEAPDAKLFVAKYCKTFTIAGPTYKVGGYGFAFPKGSLLLHDIDEALLSVFESGELKDLEHSLMASEKCVDIQPENDTASLSPQGFFIPFMFTGGASTVALTIYFFRSKLKADSMPQHKGIWILMSLVLIKWRDQRKRFSRKVSDVEIPTHSSNDLPT